IAATLKTKGFQVVPKRWIVERTFGWGSVPKLLLGKLYYFSEFISINE
ncbi:hypothetical protein MCHI_003257, partial [Candidatus Magnetoovum chiemensis]